MTAVAAGIEQAVQPDPAIVAEANGILTGASTVDGRNPIVPVPRGIDFLPPPVAPFLGQVPSFHEAHSHLANILNGIIPGAPPVAKTSLGQATEIQSATARTSTWATRLSKFFTAVVELTLCLLRADLVRRVEMIAENARDVQSADLAEETLNTSVLDVLINKFLPPWAIANPELAANVLRFDIRTDLPTVVVTFQDAPTALAVGLELIRATGGGQPKRPRVETDDVGEL